MRPMLVPAAIALSAALAACATAGTQENPGCRTMECVAIGESQTAGAIVVTPLEVIEDSRCPVDAQCVWAGRVRVTSQLQLGHEVITVELDSSQPLHIDAGMLSIAEIAPDASTKGSPISPKHYRFGFTFAPDIMDRPKTD